MLEAEVVRDPAGKALLTWTTAGEVRNLGFRVHRRVGKKTENLTPSLVAGSMFLAGSTMLTAGNTYRWLDPDAPAEATYWIESVDVQQRWQWHGPLQPRRGKLDERFAISPTVGEVHRGGVALTATRPALRVEPQHAGEHHGRRRSASPYRSNQKQFELAAGEAAKIDVEREGLYRVALPAGADAQKLALYEDGVEIPILIEDGHFLFHGTPLDSAWSAARTYWLVSNNGGGRRITRAGAGSGTLEQPSYAATAERRDKAIFFSTLRSDEGDGFVGPVTSTDPARPALQELTLSAVAGPNATLEVTIQGATRSIDRRHRVEVSFNGEVIGSVEVGGQERASGSFAVHRTRDGINQVGFVALGGEESLSAIESVRLTYDRRYRAENDRLLMTVEGGRRARLEGFSSADVRLFDITDRTAPQELDVRNENGTLWAVPRGTGTRVLVAQHASHFETPARIEINEPSRLHAAAGADFLIITHPSLAAAVEGLRAHRLSRGLRTLVVTARDIYDEYSFGAKDPAAIRALLAASRKWPIQPRSVLLIGDASFDSRNYLGLGDFDLVPTRLIATSLMRTASDSWLSDFDGDGISEIPIGRLPARTPEQAAATIAKIIAYETAPIAGDWNAKALLVSGADAAHDFRGHSAVMAATVAPRLTVTSIDSSAIGSPAARQQLLQQLNEGAVVVYFNGHGSTERWGADLLLNGADTLALRNGTRLPLVIALTCLNGYFHDLYTESLAETFLRNPEGGAIAVWTSSSLTDPIAQDLSGQAMTAALFAPGSNATLGEALLAAQRAANVPDVRRTFLLFGDPSMKLRLPQ